MPKLLPSTKIDLGLLARLLRRLPSCCRLVTPLCRCWWPRCCRKDWIYAPSKHQNTKSVSSLKSILPDRRFRKMNALHIGGPLFYTVGTNGHKHHPSSGFCRSIPWQNLIDVAELDWNVTKRERFQLTVADLEGTYTRPWQTVGLTVVRRRVSWIQHHTVHHGYLDRP